MLSERLFGLRHSLIVGLIPLACATATELDEFDSKGDNLTDSEGGEASSDGGEAGSDSEGKGGSDSEGGAGGSASMQAGSDSMGGDDTGGMAGAEDGGSGGQAAGGDGGNGGSAGAPMDLEPVDVTVGTMRTSVVEPYSAGGDPYTDFCPVNQVLMGFNGTTSGDGGDLISVAGICGTLDLDNADPSIVTITQVSNLPNRSGNGGTMASIQCPANQVVVGFNTWVVTYIGGVVLLCAPLTIEGDSPDYSIVIGDTTETSLLGQMGGSALGEKTCPADQVGSGQDLRAGGDIDTFGIICSNLELVLE